ncbi:MAG: hypothetical protein R3E12_06750 [Candidatus Eisenbacteria bacterium]|uniref:FeoB-associated Cys-rich membrane protein n=1 Tax=Eiseniibacteriota bacterium TaxID=2212470 RepID=A0A956RN14_UNCEI|nr:hypothetical protein [Candidatus Eisenbacteria bacterium]
MGTELIVLAAMTVVCPAWIFFQRWIAKHDPDAPGVEGCRGSCGSRCTGACERETQVHQV